MKLLGVKEWDWWLSLVLVIKFLILEKTSSRQLITGVFVVFCFLLDIVDLEVWW